MDRVTQYSVDVLSGDIIAGESVKLACKRHLDDMEKSKLAPYRYRFDIDKANAIIDYADKFIFDRIINFLHTLFLDAANALCFYKNLIRNGGETQDAPSRSIVTGFLFEQGFTG